jgi:hypothetical protein
MPIPDTLKFDVRVRERFLSKNVLTEAEVDGHLAELPDRAEDAIEISIKQPALQTEAEREVLVVRTLARPAQPAAPVRMFGDDDEIYDDDEKPVRGARARDLDDDDDEDDDDDDDAEEKSESKDKDKDKADSAEKKPAAEKGKESDDDWG